MKIILKNDQHFSYLCRNKVIIFHVKKNDTLRFYSLLWVCCKLKISGIIIIYLGFNDFWENQCKLIMLVEETNDYR